MSSSEDKNVDNVVNEDQSNASGGESTRGRADNFDAELERRLEMLESSDYSEPARRDMPRLDYVLLAVIITVTVVAMYWWGY